MNRTDTAILLRRLHNLWGLNRPAGNDVIDEWHRVLNDIGSQDAFHALDRLFGNEVKPPSASRLMAEIRTRVPAKPRTPKAFADPECEVCEGTGFAAMLDHDTVRYGPCPSCRPDRALRAPTTPGADPIQFATTDELLVAARKKLFRERSTPNQPA